MGNLSGLIGIFTLLFIAFLLSENKKNINIKTVALGLGLQFIFAVFILKTPFGTPIFSFLDKAITTLISFSDAGANFLFTSYVDGVGFHPGLINFAFKTLPTIIFFSSLVSVLYHFGIIQILVKFIARAMQKTMGTSGSETLSVAGNIFLGQTESPLMVRPFIDKMTKSELMAVMTGGFATVSGGVLAIYVSWLSNIPGIAGHLLAASVMSAPAALVIAKIIYPETEVSDTMGDLNIDIKQSHTNGMEALSTGATDGLKLAANIAAMLIAFISFVAMINFFLAFLGTSMEAIFGFIFRPLAWTMGVPWNEAQIVGMLMGKKIVLTELIAYGDLQRIISDGMISERTAIISTYALCGFSNFGSVGIQLGGIGAMAPNRKKDLAKLVTKAMFGGALASWLTATIAGLLI
ncbi:MAG: NupC/NupG family nucleoside CNT transporter [Candidatus Marinimicrobia bacterium]|jgi:CNT family concentrative nucleoside transporter|nr:NupC/NupG family nucleoside CNT transporter [Paracoccaceae bacterium]MBL6911879.1 NupC/NupG family nucleoside CNT transporter [Candidatus Neomarinimicrobiota bacterium]MBT3727829.1 NupC/NupG family nucleoside CNT transporter [Candidatus Neomarinimicrobiota bacterium]MBT3943922.1 NupC/NupG family nucleoside CNT transporter [Candidatus Neomarinimicrobiota bacterium]MBT4317153.1 NupC/NupG family nucleoside CNT transporter [Candidatus Neomarinimicrobiota bacterium]